ncbi:hypothetical protein CC2G_011172 [Coprinopsis cinerea AmutBmut pab1-1]|nr:hypothetical protein CC2G_011172 [Coprinopsis cinerea AmutBmut pab1-1]
MPDDPQLGLQPAETSTSISEEQRSSSRLGKGQGHEDLSFVDDRSKKRCVLKRIARLDLGPVGVLANEAPCHHQSFTPLVIVSLNVLRQPSSRFQEMVLAK